MTSGSLASVFLMRILFTASGSYPDAPGAMLFFGFIFFLILFLYISKRLGNVLTKITEGIIASTISSIISNIRKISYFSFERIGMENIYKALTADIKIMALALTVTTNTFNLLIKTIAMAGFLAFIAPPVFLLALIVFVAAGSLFYQTQLKTLI